MSKDIGALWVRKIKTGERTGEQYMSGVLDMPWGKMQIACFINSKKEKENQPDYRIILSEDRRDGGSARSQTVDTARNDGGFQQQKQPKEPIPTIDLTPAGEVVETPGEEINVKDIPF